MSEAAKNQSQNNHELDSFVCPHCRLLFSIRKNFDGNGAVCPGCETLLSIPNVHDGVEAQGLSKVKFAQAGIMRKELNEARLLKSGRWRENQNESRQLEGEDRAMRWMLPVGMIAVLILGGIIFVLLSANDDKPQHRTVAVPLNDDQVQWTDLAEKIFGHSDAGNRDLLEGQLKRYFNVETIDERIKFCRPLKGLREKMEKYYAREKAPDLKVKRLLKSGDFPRHSGFYFYRVEMSDYSTQDGIFTFEDGKVLFDWESQVAYSEMSWTELKRKMPTTPVLMRMKASPVKYYNDYFIDDKKWQSMRLYNNVNERDTVLYGYARTDGAVDQKLSTFGLNQGAMFAILLVKYPEGATNPDQVIVTEVISTSWLYIPDSEKSDEK